ncbi:MAG TPA: hypothetical protein VGQ57_00920, partial [Polyangiaceae bacterium]|jgi:hypothetical protein|nr:hypothetical protein [Polyangiaceae bacterium]
VRGSGIGVSAPEASFALSVLKNEHTERARADLTLTDGVLALGDRKNEPVHATLVADDVAVSTTGAAPPLSGALRLHVDRASALLPLVTPSGFLRGVETNLLGLKDLDATARFRTGPTPLFDLRQLRAGVAKVRGFLLEREKGPDGAFLLVTPTVNIGLRITPDGTNVSPLVSEGWLEEQARTARAPERPDRGSLPRPSPQLPH